MRLSVACLLVFAAGCHLLDLGGNRDTPEDLAPVRAGTSFTLAEGQTARLDDSDFSVTFVGVPQDSRCPADAMCVWQGEALVVVGPAHPAMRFRPDTLTTAPRPGTHRLDSLVVGPYSIRVKDVQPYPFASVPRREPYRVTFTLRQAP
jgi:hypothetical protein